LERLLSVREAADHLRLSEWTVHNWLSKGILPRVKLGSRTLLRMSDVERLIERGVGSKSPAPKRGTEV
jgi:excisionase family DNA binding protein